MNKSFLFWYISRRWPLSTEVLSTPMLFSELRGRGRTLVHPQMTARSRLHQTYRGTKQGYQPRTPSPTAIWTSGLPTNPYIALFCTTPVIPPHSSYGREVQRQDPVDVEVQVGTVEVHEPLTLPRSTWNDGMTTLSVPFLCSRPVIEANCFEPEYIRLYSRHLSRDYLLGTLFRHTK